MRILLLEDEVELATWLVKALAQSDFSVEWANDGWLAERALAAEEFDAMILDLGLPGKSGLAVLESIRAADNRIPVLILTARDTLEERVLGLSRGADDFLPKPFALAELEARLIALIRRSRGGRHPRMTCGPLVFDASYRQFFLGDAPLALTPREYALLSALILHGGQPVSKAHLLDRVFTADDEDVNPDAIEVLIYRVRKKLANTGVAIVTLRGFGYSLEVSTAREID